MFVRVRLVCVCVHGRQAQLRIVTISHLCGTPEGCRSRQRVTRWMCVDGRHAAGRQAAEAATLRSIYALTRGGCRSITAVEREAPPSSTKPRCISPNTDSDALCISMGRIYVNIKCDCLAAVWRQGGREQRTVCTCLRQSGSLKCDMRR